MDLLRQDSATREDLGMLAVMDALVTNILRGNSRVIDGGEAYLQPLRMLLACAASPCFRA